MLSETKGKKENVIKLKILQAKPNCLTAFLVVEFCHAPLITNNEGITRQKIYIYGYERSPGLKVKTTDSRICHCHLIRLIGNRLLSWFRFIPRSPLDSRTQRTQQSQKGGNFGRSLYNTQGTQR